MSDNDPHKPTPANAPRFKAGDKSKAVCPACAKVVPTTMALRDIPVDQGSGIAKDVLVAACDLCNNVAAIPAQSTPAIRRATQIAYLKYSLLPPKLT